MRRHSFPYPFLTILIASCQCGSPAESTPGQSAGTVMEATRAAFEEAPADDEPAARDELAGVEPAPVRSDCLDPASPLDAIVRGLSDMDDAREIDVWMTGRNTPDANDPNATVGMHTEHRRFLRGASDAATQRAYERLRANLRRWANEEPARARGDSVLSAQQAVGNVRWSIRLSEPAAVDGRAQVRVSARCSDRQRGESSLALSDAAALGFDPPWLPESVGRELRNARLINGVMGGAQTDIPNVSWGVLGPTDALEAALAECDVSGERGRWTLVRCSNGDESVVGRFRGGAGMLQVVFEIPG
ncbi:MAG: hypothetical protein AAF411_03195 [Myxococcota bacterium]